MSDLTTAAWTRNASDTRAAANGCRFDVERAAYVVWWIERYCKLYEGEQAGEPLVLHGCHECGTTISTHRTWTDEAKTEAVERAARFAECVAAGHAIDWQYECTMRLFGWVVYSEDWGREVRRFREASIWTAKKNKKSPTITAYGLYLTIGDGEQGQKVFQGAKDGNQARKNMGEHAKAMVEQSPELSKECKINENTLRISHPRSRSFMEPLSSGNTRQQEAKEGLNGSVVIDETHVVDRAFIDRLSRAGISRSEPMQIEVSTAGSDPEGYGKERFDLACDVLKGKVERQKMFAAVYAAPQNLTDAQLAADPAKYGRMANPAWGHTVKPSEFLSDYQDSKGNLQKLGKFKMYRLDVWQASEIPWLDMNAWANNERQYDWDSLAGMPCAAALDLAKTHDTCAEALLFWDEPNQVVRQKVRFWLPRARAEALADKVQYLEWAEQGWLTIIEGDTVDYRLIRQQIAADKERFNIGRLMYDDCYAQQLIQSLIEEDHAFFLEEVQNFSQTVRAFAGPTDEYEAQVLAGTLLHDGNPLLSWQAGNTKVKTDANLNKRPVKQPFGDVRTIDGMVAGIMALSQIEVVKREGVWSGSLLS